MTDVDFTDDVWLTVGQAAKLAQVDPSTMRRWADSNKVRARVTPGGTRQISRAGLLDSYRRETVARTANDNPDPNGPDPYSTIVYLAEASRGWRTWRPDRMSTERLDRLRLALAEVEDALADISGVVTDEQRERDLDAARTIEERLAAS